MKPILAWHFVRGPLPGFLRDGRSVVVGETLRHDGPLVLCESGFHASLSPLLAPRYAPGAVACRVRIGGEVLRDANKLVASERTVLWVVDAEETLHAFARRCALDVIRLWDPPEVVVRYLRTGDDSIRAAARNAARAAAWAAAEDAAGYAAMDAARNAAGAVAWDAAWDGAWAAAWAAAGAATTAATWAATDGGAAAMAAARAAARARQARRLTRMLHAEHRRVVTRGEP